MQILKEKQLELTETVAQLEAELMINNIQADAVNKEKYSLKKEIED